MIAKLLGLVDLFAAAFFILAGFDIVFTGAFILITFLLLLKSLIFLMNWSSWIDMVAVVFMILILFNFYSFFNLLFALWLLQKGILSLF
ncbi:hypothetical protein HY500_00815 [Candidatus Woesearchaeota archaeon]|nr:hypothetical protein [Candidatus Woesearchaeota archaeon]